MCDLVTTLDPKFEASFQFCGTMLSWEAGAPSESIKLMSKAIECDPNNWKYRYLRGITYMLFLKDAARAKEDLVAAAKLPNVHPIVIRLAAKKMAETDDRSSAIEFLENILQTEQDPNAKRVLLERLKELR